MTEDANCDSPEIRKVLCSTAGMAEFAEVLQDEMASNQFVEWQAAFTPDETKRIRTEFDDYVSDNLHSFNLIPESSVQWVYDRMIALAVQADAKAGWGLLDKAHASHTDELIYDRFGPKFSDPEFKWHVDASDGDPRLISVVAYLSDATEFEGGQFQMELIQLGGSEVTVEARDFTRGCAIAFPSKSLRHVVQPVTGGERRSFLLLVGNRTLMPNRIVG
mmetsp:Transcript_64570/g.179636  ORF Transcript_64570/g.179636 Transcript_64570/m.179636 type:complete len:219 (+) Transcript_64570:176-832(+)